MSTYRIHFKWKEKEHTILARKLDLTHPYFVSIKDIYFPSGKGLIIDPATDELQKKFSEADHFLIPFQTVSLIEEMEHMPNNAIPNHKPSKNEVLIDFNP